MVKNNLFAGKEISCGPLIIAHRGASAHAPENTLAALQMAVETQADGVEFDVRLAKDGVPVVIHDETLARTALRKGKIADFTSVELGKIDVGSWFNTKYSKRANSAFGRETIPTLAQAMQQLHGFGGLIYIELKVCDGVFRELSEAVCGIINKSPILPQIIVKSFKLAVIPEVRNHIPDIQTAALFEPTILDYLRRRRHIIARARECGADQISLHRSLITPKLASLASELQMPVTVWTVDDPAWLKRCRKLGIKALITNDPVKMLNARRF